MIEEIIDILGGISFGIGLVVPIVWTLTVILAIIRITIWGEHKHYD